MVLSLTFTLVLLIIALINAHDILKDDVQRKLYDCIQLVLKEAYIINLFKLEGGGW